MMGTRSSQFAALGLAALLALPLSVQAAQTFDPNDPAFAGAVLVPLDDSFLDSSAIAGTSLFVVAAGGVNFTFATTASFAFQCIGPAGAPPCLLASFQPITVTPDAPVGSLGFILNFAESAALPLDFDGTSADELIELNAFLGEDLFGGAYDLGGILSVVLGSDFVPAAWREMRFVELGGGCAEDADCDDGLFCNGEETCDPAGDCQSGTAPCGPGEVCDPVELVCEVVCVDDAECAGLGQVCGASARCEDSSFLSGLDSIGIEIDVEADPEAPPAAATMPTVDEPFGISINLPFAEDDLQPSRIDIFIADPIRVELPDPGVFLGDLEVVLADTPVVTGQIYVLNPEGSAIYLDLDGDAVADLDEPVAAIQLGSTIINVQLPFGGDGDPNLPLMPADGEVLINIAPVFSPSLPGTHPVRVIATGIDPDTGGLSDGQGIVPRLRLADYELEVLLPIDIEPDDPNNVVNLLSTSEIPVAILSTENFHAPSVIDPNGASFGPNGASATHGSHVDDVDADGDTDLLFHFVANETGILPGDTQAQLVVSTLGGEMVWGVDSVRTVLDADEDGLADVDDNCPGVPNGAAEPLGPPTWGSQAASAQFPNVGCACLCGDPNRDCTINVADAPEAQRAGLIPPLPPLSPNFNIDFCDINGDGQCNVGDAPEMQRAGLLPPLPPLSPSFSVTGCSGYFGP